MKKSLFKRKSKKTRTKPLLEEAEEYRVYETEKTAEEIRDYDTPGDCFSEGDMDDRGVIDRVKLF